MKTIHFYHFQPSLMCSMGDFISWRTVVKPVYTLNPEVHILLSSGNRPKVTWQMLTKWRCATLPAKRRFQTYFECLVNITWLSRAYKDRTTLADNQCILPSHWHWTRELKNRSRPRAIFTTRLPSYLWIWGYVTHGTLDTRLPFPLVQLHKKRRRSLRTRLNSYINLLLLMLRSAWHYRFVLECIAFWCHYSLDWTTGLDYWTGLLDSPLTTCIIRQHKFLWCFSTFI